MAIDGVKIIDSDEGIVIYITTVEHNKAAKNFTQTMKVI